MEIIPFVEFPAEILCEQITDCCFPRAGYSRDYDKHSACVVVISAWHGKNNASTASTSLRSSRSLSRDYLDSMDVAEDIAAEFG